MRLERGGQALVQHVGGNHDIFGVDARLLAEILHHLPEIFIGRGVEGLQAPDREVRGAGGSAGQQQNRCGEQCADDLSHLSSSLDYLMLPPVRPSTR